MIAMSRNISILLVSGAMLLLTGVLLFIAQKSTTETDIRNIMLFIMGLTLMAALSGFRQFVEEGRSGTEVRVIFNELLVMESISTSLPFKVADHQAQRQEALSWELRAGQLVGVDNALALARLRMDIEGELRRIALGTGVDLSTMPVGLMGLARELVRRDTLPVTTLHGLQEISQVCNRAIHGEEIPDDVAASVVRAGGDFLARLQAIEPGGR